MLERQLATHEYVAGEEYSIADIAHWSWISGYEWSGVNIDGLPQIARWLKTVGEKDKTTVDTGRKILV